MDETENLLPAGIDGGSILKAADIDKDKDLDLFLIAGTYNNVYLLINDGSGQYSDEASTRLPTLSNINAITDVIFGDIDGDSDSDILLAYSEGQSIKLLLNDSNGIFSDATGANLPVISGQAESIDLGDVDGDGYLDIIIASRDLKDTLLINDGSGIFIEDTNFDLPDVIDASSDILFFDIDGDGDLDIVTTNNDIIGPSSLRNRVYINDGAGLFTDGTGGSLPEDNEYSEVLDFGDIDQDADMDIVVGNYAQNSVMVNNGSGIFEDVTTESDRMPANYFDSRDAKLGDIDGDGDLDIIILGEEEATLLLNDGLGFFSEDASIKIPDHQSTPAPVGGKDIELGDIDGDGDLDIIIAGDPLTILVNTVPAEENNAPILSVSPEQSELIFYTGESWVFSADAADPDGDTPITMTWEVNGETIGVTVGESSLLS
ncbi:MAG: VCBS repeat-containing protein, partial [Candidatus Omnitrophica bacterium]|nr:VCBS repeat-containing protein [Candidatus Omnitrophota bacterium]